MKQKKNMNLVQQIEILTGEYVRKGGKRSRLDRRALMIAFAGHAQASGAREIGQVGSTHVIRYWKAHRGLKDATLRNHWYALCDFWELAEKPGQPPLPKWNEHPKKQISLKEKLFGRGMGAIRPHGDNNSSSTQDLAA